MLTLGHIARHRVNCASKRIFFTHAEAVKVAKKVHQVRGDSVHAYPCGVCSFWHIGAVEPRESKLGRRRPVEPPTLQEAIELWDLWDLRIDRVSC